MASPNLISFFILLTFFFMLTYARDSQFFSKVTTSTTPATTINVKETALIPTLNNKDQDQDQEPTFMPETQNAYGLYGHESTQTQFPTTNKLSNAPHTTATYSPYRTQTQTREKYYPTTNTDPDTTYYNNNQYSNNADEEEQQNLSETSFQESSYTTPMTKHNNNYYYYNGANGYKNEGKQGMSDTRFLQKGKFYYNINGENKYYPNQYQESRNNYDTRGYYNTNNEKTSEFDSSMESYQNQENFQDERYVP